MARQFDAIVIGTGQSGPALTGRLTAAGLKTAVIERKEFGGTCVNTGCIPTKALVASARAAHVARRAADFGVMLDGPVRVDMKRVKARKDEIVRPSREGVEKWLRGMENGTVIRGHAHFVDSRVVEVGDERLEAPRIFINTGARAVVPSIPGLEKVDYFTNTSMMEVDFLPEHLLVVGGSFIGLEFAQMYRRFGSRVTVIEASEHIISSEDEDVSEAVREILAGEGVTIRAGSRVTGVENRSGQIVLRIEGAEGPAEAVGSHLLMAVGRRPNSDDLGLEWAGIGTDDRGYIVVDDQLRTTVPGVWAMGDVNGRGAFTHTSYNDYEIVAANLLDGDPRRVTDRFPAHALYIDPPLGRAGMSERQARASGRDVLIGRMPMTRVGRARERSETQGFMKVIVDAQDKKILGASILGVNGDEVVHSILGVMYAEAPYTIIQRAMHIHPTVSELLPTLFGSLEPLQ